MDDGYRYQTISNFYWTQPKCKKKADHESCPREGGDTRKEETTGLTRKKRGPRGDRNFGDMDFSAEGHAGRDSVSPEFDMRNNFCCYV